MIFDFSFTQASNSLLTVNTVEKIQRKEGKPEKQRVKGDQVHSIVKEDVLVAEAQTADNKNGGNHPH